MNDELIVVERDEVVSITLNRPTRANALGPDVVEGMIDVVAAASRANVRLITFRGVGKGFSSGLDLSDFKTVSDGDLAHRLVRIEHLLQLVHHAPVPTLAFAHGAVYGAGADLFCACDFRVAAQDAKFRFPGVQFGVVLGTRRLRERIGSGPATRILLRNQELRIDEALRLGFVTECLEMDGWDDYAAQLASDTATVSRDTMTAILDRLRADSRHEDMAALAASVSVPGLKERIAVYRARLKS